MVWVCVCVRSCVRMCVCVPALMRACVRVSRCVGGGVCARAPVCVIVCVCVCVHVCTCACVRAYLMNCTVIIRNSIKLNIQISVYEKAISDRVALPSLTSHQPWWNFSRILLFSMFVCLFFPSLPRDLLRTPLAPFETSVFRLL